MQGEGIEGIFAIALGTGDFQVQVLAETALQVGKMLFGVLMAACGGQAAGMTVASCDGEEACAILGQPLRRDRHAVHLVAFHPGTCQQSRQRQVAGVVAAQQRQLPGRFLAVDNADVGTGDGLDAHRFGGLVELDQREQVVAVGHCQCRQFHFHRTTQQIGPFGLVRARLIRLFRHADGRIRKREFGVQVEVDKTGGHTAIRVAGRVRGNKA